MKHLSYFNEQNGPRRRMVDTREERPTAMKDKLITFSFKDFDRSQIPPGQNYEEWAENKLLPYMMYKFGEICNKTVAQALSEGFLTIYGDFPPISEFKVPAYIQGKVNWGTIQKINGQKGRVAGYVSGHTFYVVFLDMNHRFWITEKKHT